MIPIAMSLLADQETEAARLAVLSAWRRSVRGRGGTRGPAIRLGSVESADGVSTGSPL